MDNSLLAVRGINQNYIVVGKECLTFTEISKKSGRDNFFTIYTYDYKNEPMWSGYESNTTKFVTDIYDELYY